LAQWRLSRSLLSAQEQPMLMALASLAWQQEPESKSAWQQRLVFSRLAWLLVWQLVWQRQVWLLVSLRLVLRQWLAWRLRVWQRQF
jgi:hypothetical protein